MSSQVSLKDEEQDRKLSVRVLFMKNTLMSIAGFKDGKGSQANECRQDLGAGKAKKTNLLIEPPQKNTALVTP